MPDEPELTPEEHEQLRKLREAHQRVTEFFRKRRETQAGDQKEEKSPGGGGPEGGAP